MVQTLAISVRLCCHVAYGTRQTVSLFPLYLCLCRDDRSKSMFVSRQQASGRLSGDLGGKGDKGRASCCGEQWCVCMTGRGGLHSSCRGQRGGCDCEETANWSNCGGKTLGLLSGSCQCLSGLQLVTGANGVCVCLRGKTLSFKGRNWISVRVCVSTHKLHAHVVYTMPQQQIDITNTNSLH